MGAGASSGRLATGPCAAWMYQPQSSCYEASPTTRTVREMSETASRATFNEPVQNEQRRAGDSRRPPVRRSGGGSSPAHLGGVHWVPLGAATRRAHVGPQLCAALANFRPVITVRVVPAVPRRRCHIACGRYQGTTGPRTTERMHIKLSRPSDLPVHARCSFRRARRRSLLWLSKGGTTVGTAAASVVG